jgi:hypothetical protein
MVGEGNIAAGNFMSFDRNVFKKSCYLDILLGRQSAINCYSCGMDASTHRCDSVATFKDRITGCLVVSVSLGHVINFITN